MPVVSISAGPGWGKTTLLAQWSGRSSRPFAWVTIDDGDNDPIVLLHYVAAALDRISPVDASVFEALASPDASALASVLPRVAAALATIDEPAVLVLDDVHLLHEAACLDAVAELARHVPEGSQLVLSGRGAPALPLGPMRARGLVIEIDDEALRLDDGEARQLLVAAGLDPTDAELAELHGQTEGWAAGLYLAALSAKENGPGDTKARTLRGDDRLVVEYLRSELLSRLPPADLRFLMRTAVLERLSGPLCDAVLRANGSAAKLESLERSNMFVAALDRNRRWYRYHRLFHELLRAELERAEPELVPVLLARAAAWSEEHGHLDAAIGYAQEAGDVDAVARLVGQCALAAYTGGRVVTVERWLEWLEERGALGRNAVVAVVGALLATTWGRPVDAERRADLAEQATYEGTLPDGSQLIDSWLALLRAEQCRRGVARMRGDAEMALRTVAPGSLFRSSAALLVATSHVLSGDPTKADDLLARVVEDGLEVGAIEDVVVALGQRTALACGRGAWVEADEFAAHAMRLVHRFGFEAYPMSAFVSAVAARVELHRGHTRRAQDLIARADRLRPRLTYALPFLAVQTRLELARAHIAGADVDGAETMLREIEALLRRRPDVGVLGAQVEDLRATLTTMRVRTPGASTLSAAELRVLPCLATHLSFREMGDGLHLSRHTVKSHAMAIYRKLDATSRSAAVERARELGLLDSGDSGPGFMPSGG